MPFDNTDLSLSDKSVEAINTRKGIAKAAKVSHDTIAKVKEIEAKGTPDKRRGGAGIKQVNK